MWTLILFSSSDYSKKLFILYNDTPIIDGNCKNALYVEKYNDDAAYYI